MSLSWQYLWILEWWWWSKNKTIHIFSLLTLVPSRSSMIKLGYAWLQSSQENKDFNFKEIYLLKKYWHNFLLIKIDVINSEVKCCHCIHHDIIWRHLPFNQSLVYLSKLSSYLEYSLNLCLSPCLCMILLFENTSHQTYTFMFFPGTCL